MVEAKQSTNTILATEAQTEQRDIEKRVGILGGTFNPIHNGHLIIAEQVREKLGLDEIWFMPDYEPPHVDAKDAIDSRYRLAMLCLALNSNPSFVVETAEIERQGKSYTIDTVKDLKKRYPNIQFYFIIGADMVEYLPKWAKIDELVDLIQFVGVQRPGHQLETPYPVMTVDVPLIDISSSKIRQMIHEGESIRYLVPDAVAEFIMKEGLYRD
ncbi:MAG: nicotinate-nucleotide adenylyltransferase [Aerococcus sp.]|nr:nicotinate-nucleotide adenylyltransferase [Aerococcus sp.]